jgi:cbb3-type cytochrome oxidase maturation protein
MSVIFFLIAIGIFVAGGFLIAFIWSVRSGQYDDDYTPSVRMLFDNFKGEEGAAGEDKKPAGQNGDEKNRKEPSEQSINNKS